MKNIIIVLLILAVLGLGGYVVYQQVQPNYNYQPSAQTVTPTVPTEQTSPVVSSTVTDEAKDWKTYKNEKYGFEFKYPENQFNQPVLAPIIQEQTLTEVQLVAKTPQTGRGMDPIVAYVSFSVYPNSIHITNSLSGKIFQGDKYTVIASNVGEISYLKSAQEILSTFRFTK